MKSASVLLTLFWLAVPLTAQESRFDAKVDVNAVLIDATVTDARGNQILGLSREDFVVRENGVEQTIESLDYFTNRRLLTGPEETARFKVERVRQERYFVIFFQKEGSRQTHEALLEAQRAALDFVDKELLPEDLVAVASHDVRLKLFSDFTADKRALKKAIVEAGRFSLGITRPMRDAPPPSIMRNLDVPTMIGGTGRVYDALRVLAAALESIAARKVLILFSSGIGEVSDFSPYLAREDKYLYDPMIRALNGANVTVFGINLLKSGALNPTEGTVQRISNETGGEYFRNFVNFRAPLRRIENLNNGYYLITYMARHPEGKRGYQKIDVALRSREFRVKARQGYPYGD